MNVSKDRYKYANPNIQQHHHQQSAKAGSGPKKRVLSIHDHYLNADSNLAGPSRSYRDRGRSPYHRSSRRLRTPSPKRQKVEHDSREEYKEKHDSDRYSKSISPTFSKSPEDEGRLSESPDDEDDYSINQQNNADEYYNPFERVRSKSPYRGRRSDSFTRELEQYRKERTQYSPRSDREYRPRESSTHIQQQRGDDDVDTEGWDGKGSYAVHRLSKLIYNSPNYEERIRSYENQEDSAYNFPPPYSPENMDDDNDDDDNMTLVNKQLDMPSLINDDSAPMQNTEHMNRANHSITEKNMMLPPQNSQSIMPETQIPHKMMIPQPQIPHRVMEPPPQIPQRMMAPQTQISQRMMAPQTQTPHMTMSNQQPPHRMSHHHQPRTPTGGGTFSRPPLRHPSSTGMRQHRPPYAQNVMTRPQQRPTLSQTQKTRNAAQNKPKSIASVIAAQTTANHNKLKKRKRDNTRPVKITLVNQQTYFVPQYIGMWEKIPKPALSKPVNTLKNLNLFSRDTYLKDY